MTLLGILVVAAPAVLAGASETKLCCFNNWRFAGTCVTQIAKDQVCGDVLSVLNNMQAAATTYCGGSQVRGGWTEIECGGSSGGSVSGGSSTGLVMQNPSYITAVEPTMAAPARDPDVIQAPDRFREPTVNAVDNPSFITPVQPTTMQAQQPTVINF